MNPKPSHAYVAITNHSIKRRSVLLLSWILYYVKLPLIRLPSSFFWANKFPLESLYWNSRMKIGTLQSWEAAYKLVGLLQRCSMLTELRHARSACFHVLFKLLERGLRVRHVYLVLILGCQQLNNIKWTRLFLLKCLWISGVQFLENSNSSFPD